MTGDKELLRRFANAINAAQGARAEVKVVQKMLNGAVEISEAVDGLVAPAEILQWVQRISMDRRRSPMPLGSIQNDDGRSYVENLKIEDQLTDVDKAKAVLESQRNLKNVDVTLLGAFVFTEGNPEQAVVSQDLGKYLRAFNRNVSNLGAYVKNLAEMETPKLRSVDLGETQQSRNAIYITESGIEDAKIMTNALYTRPTSRMY